MLLRKPAITLRSFTKTKTLTSIHGNTPSHILAYSTRAANLVWGQIFSLKFLNSFDAIYGLVNVKNITEMLTSIMDDRFAHLRKKSLDRLYLRQMNAHFLNE